MRGGVHRRHEHDDQPSNDDHDAVSPGLTVDRKPAANDFRRRDPDPGAARAILSLGAVRMAARRARRDEPGDGDNNFINGNGRHELFGCHAERGAIGHCRPLGRVIIEL